MAETWCVKNEKKVNEGCPSRCTTKVSNNIKVTSNAEQCDERYNEHYGTVNKFTEKRQYYGQVRRMKKENY